MKIVVLLTMIVGIAVQSVGPLQAKPYQISTELQQEIRRLRKDYQADPTPERQFDLAMAYAYSGQIMEGWRLLKAMSPSYAKIVIRDYESRVKKYPDQWRHSFKLAFGYYFAGQKERAKQAFENVLVLVPSHVWTMGYLGLLEGEAGHPKKTIDWCERALAIEPNATAIHFLIAEAYRRVGNYFKAMSHVMIGGRLVSEEKIKIDDL